MKHYASVSIHTACLHSCYVAIGLRRFGSTIRTTKIVADDCILITYVVVKL